MALRKVASAFARSGLQIQATPALANSASFAQGSLPRLFAKGTKCVRRIGYGCSTGHPADRLGPNPPKIVVKHVSVSLLQWSMA
jgi:hypothetical protein